MKKIGTYKIKTSFYIPDRGVIAVCQQIDGIVRVGSTTTINFNGTNIRARITGVDMPNLGKDEILRCGLLFQFENDAVAKRIASEKLQEQIIEMFA